MEPKPEYSATKRSTAAFFHPEMARQCLTEIERYQDVRGIDAHLTCIVGKVPGESLYIDKKQNKNSQWLHIATGRPVKAEKFDFRAGMLIQVSGEVLNEPFLVVSRNKSGRVKESRLYFRWTAEGVEMEASILRIFGDGSGKEACDTVRRIRQSRGMSIGTESRGPTLKTSEGDVRLTSQSTSEGQAMNWKAVEDTKQATGMGELIHCQVC